MAAPSTPKLALPTVESCRWRRLPADGGDVAECLFIGQLTGVSDGSVATVNRDVCLACCRSFPSTPARLNPIVASLLFKAAEQLLQGTGDQQCPPERARQLKQQAEQALDFNVPEQFTITPLRQKATCCHLGPRSDPADGRRAPDDPVLVCDHPGHEHASPSLCRMCPDWTAARPVSRFLQLPELVPRPPWRYGRRIKEWAVGVTTSPRRQPTLEICLDSVVRAGWEKPRVFMDGTGPLPERYNQLLLTWREASVGALPAWFTTLQELLFQQPTADAYLLLQDDVVLFDRQPLREYLEEVLWPGRDVGLVTLFYTGLNLRPGWQAMHDAWSWGAQAFIFSPEVAWRLVTDDVFARAAFIAAKDHHLPIPEKLLEWIVRTQTAVWYPVPSLAQHIGNTSTIWMDSTLAGGRRAPWYAGALETQFAAEVSSDHFPEEMFPASSERIEAYRARVERGRAAMQRSTVVLCGLCRDVRHFLPRMAARIERLGAMFADWRLVLYENDSTDATKEFLLDWRRANPRVEVITEWLGVPRFPQARLLARAAFLARCRNICRGHVLASYQHFSHVIVLDMDLAGGFSCEGIAHSMGADDWDFVGSYGIAQRSEATADDPDRWFHIDAWAFQPRPGEKIPTPQEIENLRLERGAPLLPVGSCFGGLGIYRMECYAAAEYGGEDCEHVVLHERQRQCGFTRQYLNPSQVVLYTPF